MEKTTLNRTFKPLVRKALENIPEAELENWLKEAHPEFFRDAPDEKAQKQAEEIVRLFDQLPRLETNVDPLEVLREEREGRDGIEL